MIHATALTVISLGAGVQSSALYLMSATGELPRADYAIFADTGDEPTAVYRYLEYLEQTAGNVIPIHRVSVGCLSEDILRVLNRRTIHIGQPPFFVRSAGAEEQYGGHPGPGGRLWRKCTTEYKLRPLRKETAQLRKLHKAKTVQQWIGISVDEWSRMKPSGVKYITNVYPLVDARISRKDCLNWLRSHGHPEPVKSACVYCPFHSKRAWHEMKRNDPESFARAVEFDAKLRTGKLPGVMGDAYVHRSFKPLGEVDFSTPEEQGQLTMFGDFTEECTGMCGV